MTKEQPAVLSPLLSALIRASPERWRELNGYVGRYDRRATPVFEYAIPCYLGTAKRLVPELPDKSKRALSPEPLTDDAIQGYAFVLLEELVRRVDCTARRSL